LRRLRPFSITGTSKNLDVTTLFVRSTGPARASLRRTTFWTDLAPRFDIHTTVLHHPFNEPLDTGTRLFGDTSLTTLTTFGSLVKTGPTARTNSDWVQ